MGLAWTYLICPHKCDTLYTSTCYIHLAVFLLFRCNSDYSRVFVINSSHVGRDILSLSYSYADILFA